MKPSHIIHNALLRLEAREALILKRRYADGLTFKTIARDLDLSPPRVRVLCLRAEKRLAKAILYPDEDPATRPPKRQLPPAPLTITPRTAEGAIRALSQANAPRQSRRWTYTHRQRRPEPFGTLDEILDNLGRYPLEERIQLLEHAVDFLERGISKA